MAEMAPCSIRAFNPPPSERYLFEFFNTSLPTEDFIVWWNIRLASTSHQVDFIVLSPTRGLLIVEAKGYPLSWIVEGDTKSVCLKNPSEQSLEWRKHPLEQAEVYKNSLLNLLKTEKILCHTSGPRQGQLLFPIGRSVVMTLAKKKELKQINKHGICVHDIFADKSILFRDDIEEWKQLPTDERIQRFSSLFDSRVEWLPLHPLTNDQIQTIRGILCPTTQIARVPAKPESWNLGPSIEPMPRGATVLQSLDTKQEQAANHIGSGHRILAGVAGSGKTLILLARAKLLSESNPGARILVTCFNRALAADLRSKLSQYPNVEALHFHGWARKRVLLPFYTGDKEKDKEREVEIADLLQLHQEMFLEDRYDAILIDEAHIMSGEWLKSLVSFLRDPESGNLLIACDRSQMLRQRSRFTWAAIGVQARGRTKLFHHNYRNTGSILKTAWGVYSHRMGDMSESTANDEAFPPVIPSAVRRDGPKPKLLISDDPIETLLDILGHLLKSGVSPSDIAIIYRWNVSRSVQKVKQLIECRFGSGIVYWINESGQTKDQFGPKKKGIRLITYQSSPGLSFQHVIAVHLLLFDSDIFSPKGDGKAEAACKELYVGMTRPHYSLTLLAENNTRMATFFQKNAREFGIDVVKENSSSNSIA